MEKKSYLTACHWGTYWAEVEAGKLVGMRPFEEDPDPSPIGNGIVDAVDAPSRIRRPAVRKSWLNDGPGAKTHKRGREPFVEVPWQTVNELLAAELTRVRENYGSSSIYAGSYGWASAGRFHHAQSQLKRFLNCAGGFTRSVFTYSFAAAEAMIPHVLGSYREFLNTTTSWRSIAEHGELLVAFGGIPLKNAQIESGGVGAHRQQDSLLLAANNGVRFVSVSPLRSDMIDKINAEWLPARPNSDVAIMLGLAHTIYSNKLHDKAFLQRYCTGFEKFTDYLTGATDGVPKDAEWAASLSELPAQTIRELAHRMVTQRTMISVSWSLTRQDHGEQPFWMAVTLAAMLGQIGKPGGGIAFGFAATSSIGGDYQLISGGSVPQGANGVEEYIPVARIADMLLNPGAKMDFNGRELTYPDIQLIWWAGGNPFHHHQDLNRLAKAWEKPDTIICNDWCWNALAKRADVVLPCTTHVERCDVSLSHRDPYIIRVEKAVDAPADALDDYEIFRGIARCLNIEDQFTEGRSADEWIQQIYGQTSVSDGKVGDLASTGVTGPAADRPGLDLPDWETFCEKKWHKLDVPDEPRIMMKKFIDDPDTNPLATPSGKIEIYSAEVASFKYQDCVGHPVWYEPYEWIGNAAKDELHLISNQPKTKLHSQLDQGAVSRAAKVNGREPVLIHPQDATKRNINDGDLVRLYNRRGACLAVAQLSDDLRLGVIQMSTGAWWDPDDNGMCLHGNPNALTRDKGTSSLGQGPSAHTCLVRVEVFNGSAPDSTAFEPPVLEVR